MITIDELMTTNPYSLRGSDSLDDARKIMTEKHIRHIPVTDDDNHLLGLITQRDILEATNPNPDQQAKTALNHDGVKLADAMIRDVSVIHQSDSVRQAAIHLRSHKYGCLPVVANDCLVGIITDSDFIDIAINLLEQVEIQEEDVDFETDMMDDVELPVPEEDF